MDHLYIEVFVAEQHAEQVLDLGFAMEIRAGKAVRLCYEKAALEDLQCLFGLEIPMFGQYEGEGSAREIYPWKVFAREGEQHRESLTVDGIQPALAIPANGVFDLETAYEFWQVRQKAMAQIAV